MKYDTSHLTPLQRDVTQNSGTERPYTSEFHNKWTDGIYVDIVSGEPLYSSTHQFDGGCGWPSFSRTIEEKDEVTYHEDRSLLGTLRTEVRSADADSHLGHVFYGEAKAPEGVRHCINGAALAFVPRDEMEERGYGQFLYLFKSDDKPEHSDAAKIAYLDFKVDEMERQLNTHQEVIKQQFEIIEDLQSKIRDITKSIYEN